MGQIKVERGEIEGLAVVTPEVFGDARGYFLETYHAAQFAAEGMDATFVQDNESASVKGVLRGLHFQKSFPQTKLVRVLTGEVFDVAVDLREGSPTFGKWHGEILSGENHKQFYIPKGFAHGFYVLSDRAVFAYKCSDFYHPEDESGLAYNDPAIGIRWPFAEGEVPMLSEKDKHWDGLAAYCAARGIRL